jgi:VWFA-related protein
MKYRVSISISRSFEAVLGMTEGITIFGRKLRFPGLRTGRICSATFPLAAPLLTIVTVLLMPAVTCAQQTAAGAPPDVRYTISVNVEEVVLHATVRNRKGTPVAGLGKRNFQLFEDRVPQSIKHFGHEDIPVTVGIVIDNSGSMRPKRAEVIAAALAFAASSNPQDQMFLVNFNERVSFGLPPNMLFTDQPDQLKTAMGTVIADGRTALYDAVAVALEHLKKGNRDKKVLIVVSDGADNASRLAKKQMLAIATQSNAIIYSLGIYEPDDPENRDPQVLSALSKASGGEAYFPESLGDVQPICERIAHEIRNQYTISYIPTNQKPDGTYRTIQLRAASDEGRGLAVTTRAGYVAPLKAATKVKPQARN